MKPQDELRIISSILIPKETYFRKIQEELEKKDKIKRHKPKVEENGYQELLDDKIFGILGG